jgi:serine phosphatase RsbU (regulator of sigma subunit)
MRHTANGKEMWIRTKEKPGQGDSVNTEGFADSRDTSIEEEQTHGFDGNRATSSPLKLLLRRDIAASGTTSLPLILVLGAIAVVAYADHRVVSTSLIYLYILPIGVGVMFLRKELSYSLIAACILLHYFDSPRRVPFGVRIFHDLSALVCFTFVVYVIQKYVAQREALAKAIRKQRNELVRDVKLAAQVQRLFLPTAKPAIGGIEIVGMMQPARGLSGDHYGYIPVDNQKIQIVIADVAGKGIPAALLMSAVAAGVQLEAGRDRNMVEIVERLNGGIHAMSDEGVRYVTLILGEIDVKERRLHFINCGHNPALLLRSRTGSLSLLHASCPPIGLFESASCQLDSIELESGDLLVFYTDGVTEAGHASGEEFGMERLSDVVRRGSLCTAEQLMRDIFESSAGFSGENGFHDDVTILVARCNFDDLPSQTS